VKRSLGDYREMPKIKTKSSAKKRFKVTASGEIKVGYAFKRHNLRKRSVSARRQSRGMFVLCEGDKRLVSYLLPYKI